MSIKKVLNNVNSNADLLSYMINNDPTLGELPLPVQGESLVPIGKLIMHTERYKNAFINMINKIGLTVIDRNYWENPWETFTERGTLNIGESVEEVATDISDVFDYNKYVNNATHFLETVVPHVMTYIHPLNFQKYYKTTTSDAQMAMAFTRTDGLFDLIEQVTEMNWEGYKYDKYVVNKYMLCRRILDGTITPVNIVNYGTKTARQRVTDMKNTSNKMVFRSPNYNPAGLRKATAFQNQIMILDTFVEAEISTEVLATSFFRNDAEFKTRLAMIDGFDNHDTLRLQMLLEDQYEPFTEAELTALANVAGVIIDREWFQNYNYAWDNEADPNASGTRTTEFFNPETLKNNHWLHVWKVLSTSPFKQAVVFLKNVTPAVSSVTVSPATATISAGAELKMSATVVTVGFANKAVDWKVETATEGASATIAKDGTLKIAAGTPAGAEFTVTATSIFDSSKTGTATISTPAA